MSDEATEKAPQDKQMSTQYAEAKEERQKALTDGARIEKLIKGSLGKGALNAAGYVEVSVPVLVKYDQSISSAIYYKNPKLQVRKREGQGEIAAKRAIVERRKLEYYVRDTNLMEDIKRCFKEARGKGTGFMEAFFDRNKKHARARWAPFDKVAVDQDTDNSPAVEDLMWTARERTYGLDAARRKFKGYKWHEHYNPPDDEGEAYKVGTDNMEHLGGKQTAENKRVCVLQVYRRGTDEADASLAPQLAAQDAKQEKNVGYYGKETEEPKKADEKAEDKPAQKPLYAKSGVIAWYEVCGDALYLIKQEKAPFVVDDFPLIPLRLDVDLDKFYAQSMYVPFFDVARQAEGMVQVSVTNAQKLSRIIHLLDETIFTPEEQKEIQDGVSHLVMRKKDLLRAAGATARLDFGEDKGISRETADMLFSIFRELSSLDALTLGSAGGGQGVERSATGSALLDKRAQRLAQMFAEEFEAFVNRVFRTISQIDRSLMTREQVQRIVGEDLIVDETVWPNRVADDDPTPGPRWTEDDILGEYDIIIETGSMRYVSEDQKVADMNALVDRWNQFLAQVPKMLTELGPEATALLSTKFFGAVRRQAELMGIHNPEEILPGYDELLEALKAKPAPVAPAATAETPSAETAQASPATELPPQALSEMAQAINAGVMDPASAPPEAVEMASAMAAEAAMAPAV